MARRSRAKKRSIGDQRASESAAAKKSRPSGGYGGFVSGWRELPEHHRSGYVGISVTVGAGIVGAGLIVRGNPHALLAPIGVGMYQLCGWAAYPLVFALLAGGILRMAESVAHRPLARRSLPLQVLALWLVLLAGSRVMWGGDVGGLSGTALATWLVRLPRGPVLALLPVAVIALSLAIFGVKWTSLVGVVHGTASAIPPARAAAIHDRNVTPSREVAAIPASPSTASHADQAPIRQARRRLSDTADAIFESAESDAPASIRAEPPSHDAPARRERPIAPAHTALESAGATTPAVDHKVEGFVGAGNTTARWTLPPLHMFAAPEPIGNAEQDEHVEALAERLEQTLRSLRVDAEVRREDITVGPRVIRFGVRPVDGPKRDERGRAVLDDQGQPIVVRTRVNRILNLQPDLALALETPSLRMEAPVPGRPYVGLEVPNPCGQRVGLREVLSSEAFRQVVGQSALAVALGRDVAGHVRVGDLARFPHVLIAGATGSGKSVCLHSFICSILAHATPRDARFLMIDPKLVELSIYQDIPHLLAPVVTSMDEVVNVLERAVAEMERRYRVFAQVGVRNLDGYRRLRDRQPDLECLPAIVIVVDELADLMMAAEARCEDLICRLAQLARAAGLHLVVATQRPSVDVVTGIIKANFATRVAFAVASAVDSRTILDAAGAEHLLGRGDMLFLSAEGGKPERIQGALVTDEEIERMVAYWMMQAQPIRRAVRNEDVSRNDQHQTPTPRNRTDVDHGSTIDSHEADERPAPIWFPPPPLPGPRDRR
ncbi:MAG TPA: DNA translocase FtsK [Ktedonobacterales bacterium]